MLGNVIAVGKLLGKAIAVVKHKTELTYACMVFWLQEHLAPEIISHLEKYGASIGEIVKHLLTGLKKKGDVSNILVEALKRVRSLAPHVLFGLYDVCIFFVLHCFHSVFLI